MPFLDKKIYAEKWFNSDERFNELYPLPSRILAIRHWTPLHIARRAARFLAVGNKPKILDVGSGIGKFCLAAAYFEPKAHYYGVEQRKNLVNEAEVAKEILELENVSFIHGNFTQLDFGTYDHFYFYNSFYENLTGTDKIDDSIDYSSTLYNYYNRFLYKKLEQKPEGTRIVTFHNIEDQMPDGYQLVGSELNGLLKFWIKITPSFDRLGR